MLRSVKIENFRGLQSLELQDLGRLNLLVGANNCGKTSILEAIQLLCSPDDIESFIVSMETRGESSYNYQIKDIEFAIQNLFHNYTIHLNSYFFIYGKQFHAQDMKFAASIEKNEIRNQYANHFLELRVEWKEEGDDRQESTYSLPLNLKTNVTGFESTHINNKCEYLVHIHQPNNTERGIAGQPLLHRVDLTCTRGEYNRFYGRINRGREQKDTELESNDRENGPCFHHGFLTD
ncbi:MAG TPA: hypothetical protein DD761_01545 [Cyanobacteria bacterium UBA11691]|nr:hypothetical protein [Cyanobacteria bacterium UBA11691]